MVLIKVWCLPEEETEESLRELHKAIVAAVVELSELRIANESQMCVLFPADRMKYGLGEELIVEISAIPVTENVSDKGLTNIATKVGEAIATLYPKSKVQCYASRFDYRVGYWNSHWKGCPPAYR